jgi:hypothetical protein
MRKIGLAVVAALAIGCGGEKPAEAPKWDDERQELRYLQTLANPTPEQFKRRDALKTKAFNEELDYQAKVAEEERAAAKAKSKP